MTSRVYWRIMTILWFCVCPWSILYYTVCNRMGAFAVYCTILVHALFVQPAVNLYLCELLSQHIYEIYLLLHMVLN